MEVTSNKAEMIFRKKKDGNYENGYMVVNFKEGTDIPDKTRIKIKDAWISFYLKDKKTIPTIFINDYELVGIQEPKEEKEEENPYKDFGNSIKVENEFEQIEIKDEDLPF